MTNSQRLAVVREGFLAWIHTRDHSPAATDGGLPLRESVLIRDGFFCGRRMETDAYRAVWFIEEDELKIHQRDSGRVVAQFAGPAIDALLRESPATLAMPRRETVEV